MTPKHGAAIAIVSASFTAATVFAEQIGLKGVLIRWLWSLTGLDPMPVEISIILVNLILSTVFTILGFYLYDAVANGGLSSPPKDSKD